MATNTDLLGVGVAPQLAEYLGFSCRPQQAFAGNGTTQVGATPLTVQGGELTTTGGNTAFILSPQPPGLFNELFYVVSSGAPPALIFPPVGDYLNGVQNASFSVAQWKPVWIIQYKPHYWSAQLSN